MGFISSGLCFFSIYFVQSTCTQTYSTYIIMVSQAFSLEFLSKLFVKHNCMQPLCAHIIMYECRCVDLSKKKKEKQKV